MRYVTAILIVFLFGCGRNEKKNHPIHTNQALNQAALPCDADFDNFFKKFKSDSTFQKKHIKFPLKATYLDVEGNLDIIREDVPEAKYTFTKFLNDKEIGDTGNGSYRIDIVKKKDSVFYQMNGIDNGIGSIVTFTFVNGCWNMIAIEDTST